MSRWIIRKKDVIKETHHTGSTLLLHSLSSSGYVVHIHFATPPYTFHSYTPTHLAPSEIFRCDYLPGWTSINQNRYIQYVFFPRNTAAGRSCEKGEVFPLRCLRPCPFTPPTELILPMEVVRRSLPAARNRLKFPQRTGWGEGGRRYFFSYKSKRLAVPRIFASEWKKKRQKNHPLYLLSL